MQALTAAALLATGAAAGELCPVAFEQSMFAANPECRAAVALKAAIPEFAALAGIPGRARLREPIPADPEVDAEARIPILGLGRQVEIGLTRGFLACAAQSPDAALRAAAHEVGHVLQWVRGDLDMRDRGPERSRRREAQADQIAFDLIDRKGLRSTPDYGMSQSILCWQSSGYLSRHSHPSPAVRWIEAMRRRDKAAQAAGNAIAATGGWRLMDAQGRAERGVRGVLATSDDEVLTADASGRVRLGGGHLWSIPPEYSRHFTPREIIAYETRDRVNGSTIAEAAEAGLAHLRRTQDWSLLPGSVEGPRR